ncbi:tail fiber assembly protein [Pantoea agglomerans]|uniref:tail fiber assembly protein n=1 Tax=Enterobacter agglomerans TaxID=549 RepID=UPI0032098BF2
MSDEKAIFDESGNATQTGMATCYSYDSKTGELLGGFEFYTLIGSGIPASSTLMEPPSAPEGQIAIFKDGNWSTVEDHRGETVYSTTDGSEQRVNALGAYPDKTTNLKPLSKYDTWNGKKWVTDTTAQQKGEVESAIKQKQSLLSEANSFTQPWQTQLMLGMISDEDKASLTLWMKYYQQVQAMNPSNAPDIKWPDKPA